MNTDEYAFELQLYPSESPLLLVKGRLFCCVYTMITHIDASSCHLFVKILPISVLMAKVWIFFQILALPCSEEVLQSRIYATCPSQTCLINCIIEANFTDLESRFLACSPFLFPLLGASYSSLHKDLVNSSSGYPQFFEFLIHIFLSSATSSYKPQADYSQTES